jgi:Mor family transcriptional regulator
MATMPNSPGLKPTNVELAAAQGQAEAADIIPLYANVDWAEICPPDMTSSSPRHQELLAALPETLAEMARVTTPAAALKIAERFGGTRIYLSRQPATDSELAKLVGLPAARALGRHFGGELVEVPRASAVCRELRNNKIRQRRRSGASMKELARDSSMTERQLRRICNAGSKRNEKTKKLRSA